MSLQDDINSMQNNILAKFKRTVLPSALLLIFVCTIGSIKIFFDVLYLTMLQQDRLFLFAIALLAWSVVIHIATWLHTKHDEMLYWTDQVRDLLSDIVKITGIK